MKGNAAALTCSLEAVDTHEADDHHAEDEQIRKEGVATLVLFLLFTARARVRRRGQVKQAQVEILQHGLAQGRQLRIQGA